MNASLLRLRRAELEARVEDLISLLDILDGDPDIEENGDENDVGVAEGWRPSGYASGQVVITEDDEDGADDEDGGDTEPNGDETDHSPLSEEVGFTCYGYDGSGVAIGEELVKGLPTFWDRTSMKALIAQGVDPDRSEIKGRRS